VVSLDGFLSIMNFIFNSYWIILNFGYKNGRVVFYLPGHLGLLVFLLLDKYLLSELNMAKVSFV